VEDEQLLLPVGMDEHMAHLQLSQHQNLKSLIIILRELLRASSLEYLHNFETMQEMLLLEEEEVEQAIIMVQDEMVEVEEVEEVVVQDEMVET